MHDRDTAMAGALFTRRNLALLGVAVVTIGAGYAVLQGGSAGLASVLLVVGYCVLFPIALLA
jgi:hypothetical protein